MKKNKEIVEDMVDGVISIAIDNTQISVLRAKLYRKAGLELLSLAASIEAEILVAI